MRRLLLAVCATALSLPLLVPSLAGAADPNPGNPLAGRAWGVPRHTAEPQWLAYEAASGRQKRLLGRIALRPTSKWFGAWIPDGDIKQKVRSYIDASTGGDTAVVAQLTVFRMVPWEQAACTRLPTKTERTSYKRWIRRFVAGIGTEQHAAVVLQPDGPFALCAPDGSHVLSRLETYAAKRLGALPNVATYIDAGSAGWNHLDPANAVRQLTRAGVEHVRGFHLNTTHYESTAREIDFGAEVVAALAKAGLDDVHFTVDTAENGRPFTYTEFFDAHPDGVFNNAPACRRAAQRVCATLGIPPTAQVARKRWHLPARIRRLAREHVDGYLWAGRPWLDTQTWPFVRQRALRMARTTPFAAARGGEALSAR
ncbi:glycoside hydrolase family 6 protein [Nocardioides acrostichi]|uniref:Glucanase n=1 Tax=Nocardioides acrostichi TaxID=2784339 RepID=A0A930Y797_9ACTN|nr:glycoside hydrolase family 6 protein [Nocardioides acrostichi]MBF4161812.1 glycoside hydrolase family 6 protein [Nocardioides acrostichi]